MNLVAMLGVKVVAFQDIFSFDNENFFGKNSDSFVARLGGKIFFATQ